MDTVDIYFRWKSMGVGEKFARKPGSRSKALWHGKEKGNPDK
ncbi:hypothetical protein [Paenibacillus amylolyticus]